MKVYILVKDFQVINEKQNSNKEQEHIQMKAKILNTRT